MCGIWLYLKQITGVTLPKHVTNSFHNVVNRGPDCSILMHKENRRIHVGFHRLAIVDPTEAGNQPYVITIGDTTYIAVCNGELYNHRELAKAYNLEQNLKSKCDTEILPHLIHKVGLEKTCQLLDGVFAFCVINQSTKKVMVGRDTFGVRPMFYAVSDSELVFSSLLKGIPTNLRTTAAQFPPSHCGEFDYDPISAKPFKKWNLLLDRASDINNIEYPLESDLDFFARNIKELLIDAVRKRLMSDRPICCLLSGGLDSSLITSIVCFLKPYEKIKTFAIGLPGSTDLEYARLTAKYLGTDHHEVLMNKEDMLIEIPNIVWETETYDMTTVRASTGNYLISKYIAENTDSIVVFNGDGSDEMFMSYLYGKNAPSDEDFHLEAVHLLKNIHYFDVLRSDRSISSNGLEARTPFLDKKLVEYVLLHVPIKYRRHPSIEKHILRHAFDCPSKEGKPFLPQQVLWRQKEAFSDGISSKKDSWHKNIQQHVAGLSLKDAKRTKLGESGAVLEEADWYYNLFQNNFEGCQGIIPFYWLPKWCGDVKDPSARVLDVYDQKLQK